MYKENKIYEKGETDNGKVDAISKSSWLHMSTKTTRSHKRFCVKTTCQQKGASEPDFQSAVVI